MLRFTCGVPVTPTASVNVTVITILSPIIYKPSAFAADTLLTVGTIPSTTISLFAPNDPSAPAATKVTVASFPATS